MKPNGAQEGKVVSTPTVFVGGRVTRTRRGIAGKTARFTPLTHHLLTTPCTNAQGGVMMTDEYVQVKVDHLRHLEIFLNRMVEQGTHVHAKCWALVAAIPEEGDHTVGSNPAGVPPVFQPLSRVLPPPAYEPPVTISEPIRNDQGFYVGFRIVHPPGVECVFPPNTKQCSCGKMDLGVVDGE